MSGLMRKLSHPFIAELKKYVANQNATLGPIVISLSELIKSPQNHNSSQTKFSQDEIKTKQRKLSEVTDMIHAAHVFHRCVRDNSICDSGTATAKRLHQDNIMSLLVGDYLLAQSSVDMADLRYPRTVGFIAKGLEDYTRGEFLKIDLLSRAQAITGAAIERYSELTCGSLLSNACLSAAVLAGHPEEADCSRIASRFGFHIGSAHRLIELIRCPDTEDDKEFIKGFNKDLEVPIRAHLEQSKNLLCRLLNGGNSSLESTIENMLLMLSDKR